MWEWYRKFTRSLLPPVTSNPKLVCHVCGLGPLSGVAIFKDKENRYCVDHIPSGLHKRRLAYLEKVRWRT